MAVCPLFPVLIVPGCVYYHFYYLEVEFYVFPLPPHNRHRAFLVEDAPMQASAIGTGFLLWGVLPLAFFGPLSCHCGLGFFFLWLLFFVLSQFFGALRVYEHGGRAALCGFLLYIV